jgi:hypothetical protein
MRQSRTVRINVRFGSLADISRLISDVCLRSKADIPRDCNDVRYVPKTDLRNRNKPGSLNCELWPFC